MICTLRGVFNAAALQTNGAHSWAGRAVLLISPMRKVESWPMLYTEKERMDTQERIYFILNGKNTSDPLILKHFLNSWDPSKFDGILITREANKELITDVFKIISQYSDKK